MKNIFLKLNMAIVFVVVLFANTSFAIDYSTSTSDEIYKYIVENYSNISSAYYTDNTITNHSNNYPMIVFDYNENDIPSDKVTFTERGIEINGSDGKQVYNLYISSSEGKNESSNIFYDNLGMFNRDGAQIRTNENSAILYNDYDKHHVVYVFQKTQEQIKEDGGLNSYSYYSSKDNGKSFIHFDQDGTTEKRSEKVENLSIENESNNKGSCDFVIENNNKVYLPSKSEGAYSIYLMLGNEKVNISNIYRESDGTRINDYAVDSNGDAQESGRILKEDEKYYFNVSGTYIDRINETLEKGENVSLHVDYIGKNQGTMMDGSNPDGSTEQETADAEWYEQIISWFIRLLGKGIQALTSLIAGEDLSIDKLVFDQYSRTNLFIFKKDAGRYGQNTLVSGALDSLNDVYRLFSEIAIAIYLIILVYMGIRMLTVSTIANKQAQYKAMLFDWVRGLIILYFFPYVMRYTILLNHAFVTYLYEQSKEIKIELAGASIKANNGALMDVIEENKNLVNDEESIEANTDKEANTSYVESMTGDGDDYMLQMYKKAEEKKRISDAVVWFIMVIQVLQFLIVYLKRLITVIFLVAIFPLVSISYAIDKIGDGKSQAFNNWTKEFILQVFIQSFHAVNYVLIMGIVISLPGTNWFLKVIGITYVAKGGEILRSLFAQMKGGTGQKPLDVAKAMIKTSVAISGVKAIGNVASRTIGRNSMLGHGIGMMSAARDTAIERQALRNEIKAHEVYRDSDTYADGTPKVPEKPLDSFIESKIRTVTDIDSTKDLTNEEKKEYNRTLEDLAKLSQEDRDRVLDQMFPDSDADPEKIKENIETKEQIRYAVYAAGIHSSLQSKKKKSKADIRREVDLELKFRSGDFADNPYIQKYFNTGRDIVDNDSEKDRLNKLNEKEIKRLEKLRAVSSVEFVKRDSRNVPMAYISRAEQLDNLHIAMRNVNDDSIDNEQKDVYWRTILDAKGDDQLESVIEEELNGLTESARSRFEENRKTNRTRITEEALEAFGTVYAGKAAYTRDEFAFYNKIIDDAGDDIELNTRVETYDRDNIQSHLSDLRKTVDVELVNHSHDNGADFARTNEAIKRLRRDVNVDDDEGNKIITNNLRANISDLREGVLPELREERDEGLAMQEKAKKEMGNLSNIEMLGRITPENLQYLKERESELTSKFRKQLARGAATAAAGTAVSGFKLGTEVTVAGVATGATASGKSGNVLEDIITVVPNAVKTTEGVLHSAGSLPSRMGNYATTKIVRDEKQTDLKIINQSMKINEKYYRNQAALDKLDRDISDAERERKDLLNKIEKKIADDSKKGKT